MQRQFWGIICPTNFLLLLLFVKNRRRKELFMILMKTYYCDGCIDISQVDVVELSETAYTHDSGPLLYLLLSIHDMNKNVF